MIIDGKSWLYSEDNQTYQETDIPKLFHGDKVDNDFNLIESPVRTNKSLVGIFSTSQTQRFGKNKRGNTIYLVKPINNLLPGFMISYGGKMKGKIAVRFQFSDWTSKLPTGNIIDVISNNEPIDQSMENILMHHYNIYPKNLFSKKTPVFNDRGIERKVIEDDIFSIDPDGCQDIDDAMSISKNGDNTIIGIHIAQPIVYLDEEDILEKIKYNFSTLYLEKERKDLWGEFITSNSSLNQNIQRPAYSTFFEFDSENNLINTTHYPTLIVNSNVLTYDNASNNKLAQELYNFTSKLTEISDYHILVSYWMVKTNLLIGSIFKEGKLIPYRVNSISNYEDFECKIPDSISKAFMTKNIESATYSYTETKHASMNVENYCHFTSPIRRIMDTWIHYVLTFGSNKSKIDIDTINQNDSMTKKFHRDLNLKTKLNTYFSDLDSKSTNAYVYKIHGPNLIEIYIEELEMFKKINIFNFKFDYLVSKKLEDKTLNLTYQDKTYVINECDLLNVTLEKRNSLLPKDMLIVILDDYSLF